MFTWPYTQLRQHKQGKHSTYHRRSNVLYRVFVWKESRQQVESEEAIRGGGRKVNLSKSEFLLVVLRMFLPLILPDFAMRMNMAPFFNRNLHSKRFYSHACRRFCAVDLAWCSTALPVPVFVITYKAGNSVTLVYIHHSPQHIIISPGTSLHSVRPGSRFTHKYCNLIQTSYPGTMDTGLAVWMYGCMD